MKLATTISTPMFTRAIVRPPAPNFADGLTTVDLGPPDYQRALKQHEDYCAALERCGLTLIRLATLDGGDVCEAGNHFFIGISERTNEAGAQQLAEFVAPLGYTASFVDIRRLKTILHLKSGIASLGDSRLVVIDALANHRNFSKYDLVRVNDDEMYGANCVRVNDRVLVAAGFPVLEGKLRELGYQTIALDMTEFQKMDGGLSCLSLRF